MNPKTFQVKNTGLISVLSHGFIKINFFIERVIEANPNKKIIVFEQNDSYYDCPRMKLYYNSNLYFLIDDLKDFDILIIDSFTEYANTTENIEFIKYIISCEKFRNKTFIIFFSPKGAKVLNDVLLSQFTIYNDVIKNYSNELFLFNSLDVGEYKLQNEQGVILSLWDEVDFY